MIFLPQLLRVNDSQMPALFVKKIEETYSLCDRQSIKNYFNDER